jgi:bifunctional NMN adenylyltransferase/nudix hydrolase
MQGTLASLHKSGAMYPDPIRELLRHNNGQFSALQASVNPYAYSSPAVVLGRFQPLTTEHEGLIEGALKVCPSVLVVIGSAFESATVKNPFSYEMRKAMIEFRFAKELDSGRLKIAGLEDYLHRPKKWYREFYKLVKEQINRKEDEFILYTYGKDSETQAYIDDFDKRTKRVYHKSVNPDVNATDVRMAFFRGTPFYNLHHTSADVRIRLQSYTLTEDYQRFVDEVKAVDDYREFWKPYKCEKTGQIIRNPFPVQFMAVDALVMWKDRWGKPYFLVIKRKSEFGNGKLAIPGGYLDHNELVLKGAIRELREETTLEVDESFILRETRVIDDPARSMRGRMVTFVHSWELCSDTKPEVKGMDDAAEAFWLPIDEVYSRKRDFFSDHYHILSLFYPAIEEKY